jgi:inosine/xanthosine triphosphate pyrophosphatase family protein
MKKSELEKIIKEELAKMKMAKPMKEQDEVTLDPEVQNLVDKIIPQIDESKKMKMNEAFAEYSELIMQILAGAYGTAAAIYFGSLIALAFKKGGKEELQKALGELEKAHRGGSLGGN